MDYYGAPEGDPLAGGIHTRSYGSNRFVLQDYFQTGELNSITQGPADGTGRLGAAKFPAGDSTGEAYTAYLRATNCGARAPHFQKDSRRATINRARASLMQPHNQTRLARQLVDRTKDVASGDSVLSRFPTLMRGFVNNLKHHVDNIGADPAQAEAQLADNFLADRESFIRQNPHLFSNAEDTAMRYNCGEYRSLYWDRNRALDSSDRGAGISAAGKFGGSPGRVLYARGTRQPPLLVLPQDQRPGALGGTGVEPNVSRYGFTNRDIYTSGERTSRAEDRDRNHDMFTALQERSDRRPQNIRSRTLKDAVRGDLSPLGAPLELEARSARIGGEVGGAMSDRMRESRASIKRLRQTAGTYRPNRFAETGGTGAPQLLSILRR
jgi:hypothetical protein